MGGLYATVNCMMLRLRQKSDGAPGCVLFMLGACRRLVMRRLQLACDPHPCPAMFGLLQCSMERRGVGLRHRPGAGLEAGATDRAAGELACQQTKEKIANCAADVCRARSGQLTAATSAYPTILVIRAVPCWECSPTLWIAWVAARLMLCPVQAMAQQVAAAAVTGAAAAAVSGAPAAPSGSTSAG